MDGYKLEINKPIYKFSGTITDLIEDHAKPEKPITINADTITLQLILRLLKFYANQLYRINNNKIAKNNTYVFLTNNINQEHFCKK